MNFCRDDLEIRDSLLKNGVTRENFLSLQKIDSLKLKAEIYKQQVLPLQEKDLELYYECVIYSDFKEYIPTLKHIKKIVHMSDYMQINIASCLSKDEQHQAQNAMLEIYTFYKAKPLANPLLYTAVMNNFKAYTPKYMELVWTWVESLNLQKGVQFKSLSDTHYLETETVKALTNSPIKKEESGLLCLKFLEGTIQSSSKNILFDIKPLISKAENNFSQYAFKNEAEFKAYFLSKGSEFSRIFFMHYYDFSHLFKSKDDYLKALKELSGTDWDWPWYGSINHQ